MTIGFWERGLLIGGNSVNGFAVMPADAVATALLGRVKGLVSPCNERGAVAAASDLRYAKARRNQDFLSIIAKIGRLDRLADPHGSPACLAEVRSGQHDCEFLATVADVAANLGAVPDAYNLSSCKRLSGL